MWYDGAMSERFEDIRLFFERVDRHLAALRTPITPRRDPGGDGSNPCGTCVECCRYSFYLSRYEFEYLEDAVRRATGSCPAEWVTCMSPQEDPRMDPAFEGHERCPLYQDGVGCMGYAARPLACRTLGPMLPCHSKLPEGCIYTNPTIYDTATALPHWDEYALMLKRHFPSPPGYFRPVRPAAPAAGSGGTAP